MDALLKQLRVFDVVLLDTPPMGYFVDTEVLAEKADASMLVVRQDCTPAADINDAIDTLKACNARFLGCILNDITFSLTEGYGGYGYGYNNYYNYMLMASMSSSLAITSTSTSLIPRLCSRWASKCSMAPSAPSTGRIGSGIMPSISTTYS